MRVTAQTLRRSLAAPILGLVLSAAATPGVRAQETGQLVIIGGGPRPAELIERIVELAGADECHLVIIPMASSEPLDTALYQRWQFEEAGCPDVGFIRFDRATADSDEIVDALERARGIFFSGGDQNRLTEAMLGSRLLERVREIYAAGGVIAGTSAGAAVMSRVMITGEVIGADGDPRFDRIRRNFVATSEGFGFVSGAIVDQHFVARGRQNRLLSLVLEDPSRLGIGIDESTAAVFTSPTRFEVLGESQVLVYDAAGATVGSQEDGDFSAMNLKVHLLTSGDVFDLSTRAVVRPEP